MRNLVEEKYYPPIEEKINIFSHGIGFIVSIFALIFMVLHAIKHGNVWHLVSFSIFGASMILLYAASTSYHSSTDPGLRFRLKILDHASIYILIAGTYTPFALVTLSGTTGWLIFGFTWGMALIGIILKLFFTGRYNRLSTIMYILMGWTAVIFIKPLIDRFPVDGLIWLLTGGISYTIGAVIYSIKRIKFNHAIFHLFVLFGSFCHFLAVFYYILPWNH